MRGKDQEMEKSVLALSEVQYVEKHQAQHRRKFDVLIFSQSTQLVEAIQSISLKKLHKRHCTVVRSTSEKSLNE